MGYTAEHESKQIPLNICFVLDKSGSMAGYYRIERLKEALSGLIQKMDPNSIISIVSYENNMKIILKPKKLGSRRGAIITQIESIQAGGGTNMLEAMKTGYDFVKQNYLPEGNNRIVLLTDGYDENEVKVLVDAQTPYNSKIQCTTVGVGESYNYALLKQLASHGGGMLHFIGSSEQFDSVFNTQLMGIMSPIATNVSLEIEYNKKIIYKHLYGLEGLEQSKSKTSFKIPNLYSGANNVALVEFDLVNPDSTIEKQAVIIRIKYKDYETKKWIKIEEKAFLKWDKYTGQMKIATEAETKKLYCIAIMNQALKVMADAYGAGNTTKASTVLERTHKQVKDLYPKSSDKDISSLLSKMDQYISVFENIANKEKKKVHKTMD